MGLMAKHRLPFEEEIYRLEDALARMEADPALAGSEDVRQIRQQLAALKKRVYGQLDAWQTIQVARHPERPQLVDYIDLIFDEFVELHGDRAIGDDRAIRCGFARLGDFRVLLVGQHKGRTVQER